MELVTHVDVRGVRADAEATDDAALDARVRVELHERAIFERAGLALVGVDDEVCGFSGFGRPGHEAPFDAHREAGAAAPPDVRGLHLDEERVSRHASARLACT